MVTSCEINGKRVALDVEGEMPLLWALRDELNMLGTKYGCGIAACGACTVHVDGQAVRSCVLPVSACDGKKITTIEGLATANGGKLTAIQAAWIKHQVPQCGYCQSGMIMAAVKLLRDKPKPTDADIDSAMTNICRCSTYVRVRAAIHDAAKASA
jgi:isoquinoline 1-oxidoreductase subunit alpha